MVEALLKHERIRTTVAKAKEIRRVSEKIITKAKVKNLHNIRNINRLIKDKDLLMKLFDDIAPRYENRSGGYTRVIKLGRRAGDGAEMAYLELVEEVDFSKKTKKTKKKATKKVEKKEEAVVEEVKEEASSEPVVEDVKAEATEKSESED